MDKVQQTIEEYLGITNPVKEEISDGTFTSYMHKDMYKFRRELAANFMLLKAITETKPYLDLNFAQIYACNTMLESIDNNAAERLIAYSSKKLVEYYNSQIMLLLTQIYDSLSPDKFKSPRLAVSSVISALTNLTSVLSNKFTQSYHNQFNASYGLYQTLQLVNYDEHGNNQIVGFNNSDYNCTDNTRETINNWSFNDQIKVYKLLDPVILFKQCGIVPGKTLQQGRVDVSFDNAVKLVAQNLMCLCMLYGGIICSTQYLEVTDSAFSTLINSYGLNRRYDTSKIAELGICPHQRFFYESVLPKCHASSILLVQPEVEYNLEGAFKGRDLRNLSNINQMTARAMYVRFLQYSMINAESSNLASC